MEPNDLDDLDRQPALTDEKPILHKQLLCLHNRLDYRIETSGRSGEIAAKISIAPRCRDCGIPMHFEQPTMSHDETRLWVRLVPGIGGECVPVE